ASTKTTPGRGPGVRDLGRGVRRPRPRVRDLGRRAGGPRLGVRGRGRGVGGPRPRVRWRGRRVGGPRPRVLGRWRGGAGVGAVYAASARCLGTRAAHREPRHTGTVREGSRCSLPRRPCFVAGARCSGRAGKHGAPVANTATYAAYTRTVRQTSGRVPRTPG